RAAFAHATVPLATEARAGQSESYDISAPTQPTNRTALMNRTGKHLLTASAFAAALSLATVAEAADCRTSGSFESWLSRFKAEAQAQGISKSAIDAASPYLVYDQRIVNIDRGQRIFAQPFLEFSGKMLSSGRISQGGAQIQKHRAVFDREEKQYGVSAAVITGFWGLESDFGA